MSVRAWDANTPTIWMVDLEVVRAPLAKSYRFKAF